MPFNELQKSKIMLVRNLYTGSFINLFIFNVTSIVSISFVFDNHVLHYYYARFYNEKLVKERVEYMNMILFSF
jgi:hypothetical protein